MIDFGNAAPGGMLKMIVDAAAGVRGSSVDVADLNSSQGSISGWLLEMGMANDFVETKNVFDKVDHIVDGLISLVDEVQLEERVQRRARQP
jgi:hypothetical protein